MAGLLNCLRARATLLLSFNGFGAKYLHIVLRDYDAIFNNVNALDKEQTVSSEVATTDPVGFDSVARVFAFRGVKGFKQWALTGGTVVDLCSLLKWDLRVGESEESWVRLVDHLKVNIIPFLETGEVIPLLRIVADLPLHIGGSLAMQLCEMALADPGVDAEGKALASVVGFEIAHAVCEVHRVGGSSSVPV